MTSKVRPRLSSPIIVAGLVIALAACASEQSPYETTVYRSFPRTARIPQTCQVAVSGMEGLDDPAASTLAFETKEHLEAALLNGLTRTCSQVEAAGDARAADAILVTVELVDASSRLASQMLGNDEVRLAATVQLDAGHGSPVLERTMGGKFVQSAAFDDKRSAVQMAFIDLVDEVNQFIFDHRRQLRGIADGRLDGP